MTDTTAPHSSARWEWVWAARRVTQCGADASPVDVQIAAGDDGKAKAWVKCFTGETSWAFSSRMRCCRSVVYTAPAFHHTGRISGVALQDDTTQQWIVDGTLQRVHQDRQSTFNIRYVGSWCMCVCGCTWLVLTIGCLVGSPSANRDGNVFTGQLNYGGLTERWLGIRSSPVSQFNLSPVLESGQCQDVPMLRFDSYTAVDVAAANRVVLGGWQTYTIEAWVCPTAPRVLLPSSLNEGNAGDNQVLQTIFSKANRGSRGELEFGLTPDLRVVARRAAGVTLVPPATMRIGEPAFLIFEVRTEVAASACVAWRFLTAVVAVHFRLPGEPACEPHEAGLDWPVQGRVWQPGPGQEVLQGDQGPEHDRVGGVEGAQATGAVRVPVLQDEWLQLCRRCQPAIHGVGRRRFLRH